MTDAAHTKTFAVSDEAAAALIVKWRSIFPGDGWPDLVTAKELLTAAASPEMSTNSPSRVPYAAPDLSPAERVGRLLSEALKLAPAAGLRLEITIKPAKPIGPQS